MAMHRRILILSTAYLPLIGGSELAAHHIARRLEDVQFDVVTGPAPGSPAVERVGAAMVYRVSGGPRIFLPLKLAWRAWRLMRSARYDALHAYQASYAGGAGWLLKALAQTRVPLIITLQEGKDLRRQSLFIRVARRLMLRRADRVTAISIHLAEYARQLGCRYVDIIPNGVDVAALSAEVRVHNPDPTILTVSRLVPKNNIEGVLRAFARVRETIPHAHLVIAGGGPLRGSLEALAATLGVRGAVTFMSAVPHDKLAALYAVADVFVRPSISEGLGNVFLEAMAARVPVVASPVGGIPDIVHHEQTGLFCDPHDPEDIARQLIRAMTDVAFREHVVEDAFRMVRERYDWISIAQHMRSVYDTVIGPTS